MRKWIFLIICMLCSVALWSQSVVIGRIIDEKDSLPVAHAWVIAGKDTVMSDSLGQFTIFNSANAKELLVVSRKFPPQAVTLSGENEYALTVVLKHTAEKFVNDKKLVGKQLVNPDKLDITPNDTTVFSGRQGKFAAYLLDADTKEPIEYANVYQKETGDGVLSDSAGYFDVLFDGIQQTLEINALSYKVLDTVISDRTGQEPAVIYLRIDPDLVGDVVVRAKRTRYRNKNNPAVALIRRVIDRKSANRMLNDEDARYEVYDKMVFYVSNLPRFVSRNFLFKPFRFMFENEDTVLVEHRRLLPMFVSETISDHYFDAKLNKHGKVITSEKRMRFDSRNIESGNISAFLDRLYDQVDIYDDKIRVLDNYFLSPIAPAAPNFYKFYIRDTVEVDGRQVVKLHFQPRNKSDFLFEGKLYVTLAPDYAVVKAELSVPESTPLNWTNGLDIALDFERQENGKYWQTKSSYLVNFGLFNSKRGAVGLRYIDKSKYQSNPVMPDSVFAVKQLSLEHEDDTLYQKPDAFWQANRPIPLSYFEHKAYQNLDSMKNMRYYRNLMSWAYVVGTGLKPVGKFELGSIYDVVGYNPVEGVKFRVGARTNLKYIPRLFAQAYLAYGLKDERFKYFVGATYSLRPGYVYGFPMHNIHLSYQYDVRAPGQPMGYASHEKPQDLIRRGDNYRYLYNGLLIAQYTKEFQNRMALSLQYNNFQQEAAGSLYFTKADGSGDTFSRLTTNEFGLSWRYAPGERFIQNKSYRTYNANQAWVFDVKAIAGFLKGYTEEPMPYQKLEANITKRFSIAPFGRVEMFVRGGYLFGSLPYSYLFVPQGNQSYRFSVSMYNMMNFMEFASDRFASITLDYHMKGFILHRIPVLRRINLREVFGFKAIWAGIRNENLPEYNSNLLKFPVDENGNSIVHPFTNVPYIEASVGLSNIGRLMRIDLVKRFTYRDFAYVPKNGLGLRLSFGFNF